MRPLAVILACAMLSGLIPLGHASGQPGPVDDRCGDRDLHPPIEIRHERGPLGLTWTNPVTGETEPRPGTGIVGGDGTAEDPYRIEGHCIKVGPQTIGVSLYNTSSYVVVQDNRIVGADGHETVPSPPDSFQFGGFATGGSTTVWGAGVASYLTENVDVVDNRIEDVGIVAVYLEETAGTEIRGNQLVGNDQGLTVIHEVEHVRVEANEVVDNGRGISLRSVEEVQVTGNRFHSNQGFGIDVRRSEATMVEDNRVTGNEGPGVLFYRANTTELVGNVIAGNQHGILAVDNRPFGVSEDNRIAENRIVANDQQGILLDHSRRTLVENNTIAWNGAAGIDARSTEHTQVKENSIEDNGVGLRLEDVDHPVDGRENWWGDASGPSGGTADACSGEAADGEGDAIVTVEAPVCFDPWLESAPSWR